MNGVCEFYFKGKLMRAVPLEAMDITIGRHTENLVCLFHPQISRNHGTFRRDSTRIIYQDHSRHGSRINGSILKGGEAEICHGDIIELGEFRVIYNVHSKKKDVNKTDIMPEETHGQVPEYHVIVQCHDKTIEQYHLSNIKVSVGAESSNRIIVAHKHAPPHIMTFVRMNDGVYLYVDADSVYLNGQRLNKGIHFIRNHDRIACYEMKFWLGLVEASLSDTLVGDSRIMFQVKRSIEIAATRLAKLPVLITGESGTGKDLAARMIHANSDRSFKNFVPVNCSSIPESLAESLLFGHQAGSFTDAREDSIGYFQKANGGTLFLDEIGDLPPGIQVKILRAIETQEIYSVGSSMPTKVNIRFVAATNKPITDRPYRASHGFRDDLYFRLAGFEIVMPSLKQHKEDIPALVDAFHKALVSQDAAFAKVVISKTAYEIAEKFDWPGNVRELQHETRKAIMLADRGVNSIPHSDKITPNAHGNKYEQFLFHLNEGTGSNDVSTCLGISRATYFRWKRLL